MIDHGTVIVHTHSKIWDMCVVHAQVHKTLPASFRTNKTVILIRCVISKTTKSQAPYPPRENLKKNQYIKQGMTDATEVDFGLSDVSGFSPENDIFILVVVSALSLLGINHYLWVWKEIFIKYQDCSFMMTFFRLSSGGRVLMVLKQPSLSAPS